MNNKKIYIVFGIFLLVILVIGLETASKWQDYISKKPKIEINTKNKNKITDSQKEILHTLVGLQSKEMKIVDNPLRIEGTFKVPEKTVLSYIKYYLKTSKNKEIENVDVSIDEKKLKISAKYKLLNTFKTPIEINVVPSITKASNIRLDINDIKVLGLSIDDDIINSIVESWFSDMDGIEVSKGDVIIQRSNFKDITIKSLSMEDTNISIGLNMKLE